MLALKLFLVPSLIAAISLASRRWGPAVAGWLSGFPVVSAPVLFILGLEQGPGFAASAAAATLAAVAAVLVFVIAYAWLATRATWPPSLAGALAAYALAIGLIYAIPLPLAANAGLLYGAIWAAPRAFPQLHGGATRAPPLTVGEIVLRMAAAALLVLGVTTFANDLGTRWSGLFAMFPVVGIVLSVSSQRHAGAAFTVRLLRGMVLGFYAFTTFCLALALAVPALGLGGGFCTALAAAALVQAAVMKVVQGRLALERGSGSA